MARLVIFMALFALFGAFLFFASKVQPGYKVVTFKTDTAKINADSLLKDTLLREHMMAK